MLLLLFQSLFPLKMLQALSKAQGQSLTESRKGQEVEEGAFCASPFSSLTVEGNTEYSRESI